MKTIHLRTYIPWILICLLCVEAEAKEVYSFGVVPQQASVKLAVSWVPLIEYLEKKTGHKMTFVTAKDINAFEEKLAHGEYDFAYMNPHHYVTFHEQAGYKAFAVEKGKKLTGIVVVKKDSKINDIAALDKTVMAFPSPQAFAATLIVRSELLKKGVSTEPKYVLSHDSVYKNVASGNFVAGGGVMRTFNALQDDVRNSLRILYKTKGYTPHAFTAHKRVADKVISDISLAMQSLHNTEEGRALLERLELTELTHASDKDWDDVRQVKY